MRIVFVILYIQTKIESSVVFKILNTLNRNKATSQDQIGKIISQAFANVHMPFLYIKVVI